jgi:hypothetical protein
LLAFNKLGLGHPQPYPAAWHKALSHVEDHGVCLEERSSAIESSRDPPGKHRDLQRVTVPYAKLLDMVDTTSEHGDAMDLVERQQKQEEKV